ncbi:SH3 domain-containing protein [Pseudoxanthobacter sp.]|uniref:SH3 domain-containing protein n=1 Tax=Pseudoxanthobacter sp. TaxID=1925742 RepID=UPI002FE0F6C6
MMSSFPADGEKHSAARRTGGIAAALAGVMAGLLGIGAAAPAQAASPAVTTGNVNLRAGPGTNYPAVGSVPRGASVTIYGCLSGYTWCDSSWGSARGWIAAGYLQVVQAGQPAAFSPAVAAAMGLAVVGFSQAYWNTHYVGRPWYGQWNRYYRPAPAPVPPRHYGNTKCVNGPNGGGCVNRGVTVGPYGNAHGHTRAWRN